MKNRALWVYYKTKVVQEFTAVSFYVLAAVFNIVVSGLFFFKGQFFSGNGSTNLVNFWANVPYACILFVPAMCGKKSLEDFDVFVPCTNFQNLCGSILSDFTAFFASCVFLLVVPFFVSLFGDCSPGEVVLPFVFLLFYGLLAVSLCHFVRSFTDKASLGFVISSLVLAFFNCAHLVHVYLGSSVFSGILKSLSFAWHFDAASKGIFDTRDFVFLVFGCFLFCFLALVAKEIKKGRRFTFFKRFIPAFLVALLVFANSFRYYKRVDFSRNQSYSISEYSKEIAQNLSEPLKISYYQSKSLLDFYPQIRDVRDFLEEYALVSKNISLSFYDPEKDEKKAQVLMEYGIIPQSFRSSQATKETYTSVYSAVIIEYGGAVNAIPFILSAETLEFELDGKLLEMAYGKKAKLHVVMGNNMSLDEDYGYIRPWLENQNITVDEIILDRNFERTLQDFEGPLLVIGSDLLGKKEFDALENYMADRKGKVLLAASPVSANITGDWSLKYTENQALTDFLWNYGMIFENEVIKDLSCVPIVLFSDEGGNQTESMNYPLWITLSPQIYARQGMNLFWAMPITLTEKAEPYLVTSSFAWTEKLDFEGQVLLETNPFYNTDMGTSKNRKSYTVGAISSSGNFILVSDQLFLNTLMNGYAGGQSGDYRNFDFLVSEVLFMNDMNELSVLQGKTSRNDSLYKITEAETFNRMKNITLVSVFGLIPAVLAVLCAALKILKSRSLKSI